MIKSTTRKERYLHFRDLNISVYARWEPDRPTVPEGWYGDLAVCSPEDQFNRATGRQVARRKYLAKLQNSKDLGYTFGKEFNYETVRSRFP